MRKMAKKKYGKEKKITTIVKPRKATTMAIATVKTRKLVLLMLLLLFCFPKVVFLQLLRAHGKHTM